VRLPDFFGDSGPRVGRLTEEGRLVAGKDRHFLLWRRGLAVNVGLREIRALLGGGYNKEIGEHRDEIVLVAVVQVQV